MDAWKQKMFRMATDKKFHDISFIVGSGNNQKKIGCNRTLLSIHCPVFEAMFESSMLEQTENCVKIPDISPIVFSIMLQWMSTNTLNISSICDLDDLIKLADKYQINGLISSSIYFLKYNTITIHIIIDEILKKYHGADLGLTKNLKSMSMKLRILSYSTVQDVINAISKQLNWKNSKQVQLWRISNRKNGTTRPNRYLQLLSLSALNINKKKKKRSGISKQEYNYHRHHHHHNRRMNQDIDSNEDDQDDVDSNDDDQESNDDDDDDDEQDDIDSNIDEQEDDVDDDENNDLNSNQDITMNNNMDDNTDNLFNIVNMKCSICYRKKQNLNRKRNKQLNDKNGGKKIDWHQYCGDNPTKGIYARLCVKNGGNNDNTECKTNNVDNNNNNNNNNGNNKNYDNKILLFLKYYDVYHEYLSIVGSILVDKYGDIELICKAIRDIAHWSDEHEILLWEEEDYNTNKINRINLQQTISEASLVDGDIIVFQSKSNINLQLMNAKTYLITYNNQNNNNQRNNDNKNEEYNHNNNNNNNNNNNHSSSIRNVRNNNNNNSSHHNNQYHRVRSNNNNNNNSHRMNLVAVEMEDDQYIL